MTDTPEPAFSVVSSCGYEWAEFHVFRHPRDTTRYVTSWSTGCSCNIYTPPTPSQLDSEEPLTFPEVRRRLLGFFESQGRYYFTPAQAIDASDRLTAELGRPT